VINNFGDDLSKKNFKLGCSYFNLDEPETIKILDRFKVRYVVVSQPKIKADEASMWHHLFYNDGCGLSNHRLIFEEGMALRPGNNVPKKPMFKIFEYVRGARVTGKVTPGMEVSAQLDLHTHLGRKIAYEIRTKADSKGNYVLQLPYATGTLGDIKSEAFYRIKTGGRHARIEVNEKDVTEGRKMTGPDLL